MLNFLNSQYLHTNGPNKTMHRYTFICIFTFLYTQLDGFIDLNSKLGYKDYSTRV